MKPFLTAGMGNDDYGLMMGIPPGPKYPSINAYNSIVQVHTCLSKQMPFNTYVDVNNSINKSNGVD